MKRLPAPDVSTAITEPAAGWKELAVLTPARVALGRSGVSLPTRELLSLGLAHARARDAVHTPLDVTRLIGELLADGWPAVLQVCSRAQDRACYLARPDWGRTLSDASRAELDHAHDAPGVRGVDLLLVLGDGLSSAAVQRHAPALLRALRPRLGHLRVAPVVVATQARVALADELGQRFGARVAASIIGERPGLSSPDSLGIYLTAQPRVGRVDAERNCISNIHQAGMSYDEAALQCAALIEAALNRGVTGVALAGLSAAAGAVRASRASDAATAGDPGPSSAAGPRALPRDVRRAARGPAE